MPYFSSTTVILFVAVCALLIIAKLLKVEKLAAVLGVGVIILWLSLYFTGYDKTLNHILFSAPPLEHKSPFNR
jgi:hypothetical protein